MDGRVCLAQQHHNRGAVVEVDCGRGLNEAASSSWDLDIRRPELKGVCLRAPYGGFKDEKGYGRITADDGKLPFVLFSAIEVEGYRTPQPG